MGKAMGAGMPLSGVAASSELWAAADLDRPSATSTSYGGNPLACAAGLAVLDALDDPGLLENVRSVGRALSDGLDELAGGSADLSRPRGVGLMLGFDLLDPDTGELAGPARRSRLLQRCRDRGLLIAADRPRVRLSPPLTLSHAEADAFLAILAEALE
jgi:4-aminobutyrate aminotransferase-like enzyme